ncbi:MAG TPA: hypothetical protein GXZ96_07200 [Firmicutes bacterium]|jgi:tetratricopeptide (TPR) repeat protein|nr:hypothetical protein [Bacillota bacterium]
MRRKLLVKSGVLLLAALFVFGMATTTYAKHSRWSCPADSTVIAAAQDKEDEQPGDWKEAKRAQQALRHLMAANRVLAKNPLAHGALLKAVRTNGLLGDWEAALELADRALEVCPNSLQAGLLRAVSLYQLGNEEGAQKQLEAMAAHLSDADEDADEVYKMLGKLHRLQKQFARALERFEAAATRDPDDEETFAEISRLRKEMGAKQLVIYVKGHRLPADVPPQIKNGRALVPFRALAERLGASVTWDPDTRTVTVQNDDVTIELVLNGITARVNGQEYTLDVPPGLYLNRVMVPLRFISECLHANPSFDGEAQMIVVP